MSSEPLVTLYDLDSTLEPKAFSPHTWRTRLVLNYKRIPYKTVWLAFPDVSTTLKQIGVPPLSIRADGTPIYCCPSISAKPPSGEEVNLIDSGPIAEYLDANYEGPKLFPPGSKAAQQLFVSYLYERLFPKLAPLLVPITPAVLEPRSVEYYERARKAYIGAEMKDLYPAGPERGALWETVKKEFDILASIYDKNEEGGGIYFMGSGPTYADIVMVATFLWAKSLPTDRDGANVTTTWDIIKEWNNGKWVKMLERFSDYRQVV
ncbi:hypothetical protein FRC03_003144 [Tulasnella sp. 419]|nr:hypothetical protein FRC03_003144 [Tulasnella sp. 419]